VKQSKPVVRAQVVTEEEANAWCLWNARRLTLPSAKESRLRAAGHRLWAARHDAGLDPVTGDEARTLRRKRHPTSSLVVERFWKRWDAALIRSAGKP